DDVDSLALAAVLAGELAPAKPAVDRDRPALREVPRAVLALRAEHADVEVVGLILPLAGLRVLPPAVDRQAQRAHTAAGGELSELRIPREVAGQDHAVDVLHVD